VWLQDLVRDPSANRIRRFGQALVLAAELPNSVRRLHAHFLHTPASVTRYAAMILELPWSVSAHARDIWTSPDWEKREKLADCRWAVTCTAANVDHLRTLAPESKRISLAYHGLDLTRFPPRQTPFSEFDGSQSDRYVRILSVGRAVEKKGYDDLLESFSRLPKTLYWRFTHVGGGPLLKQLKRRSRELGLEERVSWMGALSQNEVLSCYREADVFVLASRIAGDGDRDGLPNVLMEAQTQSLPCVATCISAIPELIEDGVNGLLVSPEDPDSLADALRALISTPSLRHCLGECADRRVRERFSLGAGIELLAAKFEIPVTNISK
jgi:glycosyltransferase involved in cell wall biosynthesis